MIDILEVYRVVSGIDTKVASIASDDAILANGIMNKNEVSVTVVTDTIPDIQEGDFIRVGGIKYKINRASEFADKSSVNHTTTYLFEAPEYTLIDKILTNKITKSVRVTLTGKLRDWLELLIWNVNKTNDNPLGVDTGWQLGNIPDTEYMTLSFDGIDCRSLLSELASAYGYEYYVHDHTINYVSRIENERNLTFTQGQGGGLYEVEQSNVDSGDVTTRVYPVGGTKNMAPGEGDEEGRLMLPEKYLENFSETNRAVEKKIVFDNIHPSFTGFVENPTGENYREFICRDIDFNIDELAIGDDARINFLTGDLMGKSFEFKWDNSNKKITLIYQEDELASIDPETQSRPLIPSAAKHLRGGEEFNFTGIRLGEAYKQAAISKLREKATDWLAFYSQKRVKFTLDVDYRYMREKGGLECGDLITVSIPSRNISRIIRIVSTEKNLKTGKLSCVVSNYLTEKWEDKIEGQISSMQATINGGGGNGSVTVLEKYDERPFTDKNVLSSLRTLKEIADNAVSKKLNDTAAGLITFLKGIKLGDFVQGKSGANIDDLGNAEFLTAVIRELLRSTRFVDGMFGEGWQLWIDKITGLSNLTIDKITVRQTLVAMELLIEKVRSVGGQLVVSAANGKIKTVTREGNNYRITFEQENTFVAHDLMRCAVFTGAEIRGYWVEVSEGDTEGITVPQREFGGTEPKAGDECVLMGNTENPLRQNLISISATEDGQPRVDILDGVMAKNFNGCLRCRVGNLDGIKDSAFPANSQPHGNGLYGDNVYLKGTFVLMTGEDILTKFEITEGKIQSAVEGLRDEVREEQSFFDNTTFTEGMSKWISGYKAAFLTFGGKWILAGNKLLVSSENGNVEVVKTGKVPYVRITNSYIMQKNGDFRTIPDFKELNGDGLRIPGYVYLSFHYKVVEAGHLRVEFVNGDKTGFENFNMFAYDGDLPVGGEKVFNHSGLWNGTGDFKLSFTGVIQVSLLVFSTDRTDALAYKYATFFEQSDKMLRIAAANFDKDGNVLEASSIITTAKYNKLMSQYFDENGQLKNMAGLVTSSDFSGAIDAINENFGNYVKVTSFAGLFAQEVKNDSNIVKQADISVFITENEAGELISKAQIRADQIDLKGAVTFESFNSSLKDTINGKADSSSLGTLAYKNNIAKDLLNADLSNLIDGKMNSSDAGKLAYVDSVEAAQLGSTIIVGGYLNTDYIKVNRIDAQGARVGGFTIDSGRLHWKANDYLGGDSRSLKLGASSSNTDGVVDVAFNAATTGRFGVKAVGSNSGGAAIYASTGTLTYPGSSMTYAGFFVGSTSVRGELDSDCCASKGFRFITGRDSDGTYTYNEGVNWGNGAAQNPDLDKIRLIVRGGIIVGYTGE